MLFFIKSIKDWSTLGTARVISYDLPLSSDDGQTGTLVVADGVTPAHVGQAITDEAGFNLWIIKAVKPAETEITVTLGEFIEVFDRNIIYDESLSQLTTTAFIRQVLINNFVLISDPEYVVRVTPVDGGSTGRVIADLTSDNLFNPTAYIRKARQYGISVQITSTVAGAVMVFREENYAHNLPFDDGHSQLAVFEQDKNIVAKVTTVKEAGSTDYYIQPDGSISTTAPSPRIRGTWETIIIAEGDEENESEKVKEEFAKTNDSQKLEFYSDREFEHGSRVSFYVRGEAQTAQISSIAISSTDDRYHYTAGNLPRTLTEKMRKATSKSTGSVSSSGGGGILSITGGGTGADNTADARANLGFMKSLATASGNGYAVGDTFGIPGADKYTLFLMRTKTTAGGEHAVSIIATKTAGGETIGGVGGQALNNDNGNMRTAQVRIVKSGTQWKLTHCGYINHIAGGSHSASTTLNISEIIGIV